MKTLNKMNPKGLVILAMIITMLILSISVKGQDIYHLSSETTDSYLSDYSGILKKNTRITQKFTLTPNVNYTIVKYSFTKRGKLLLKEETSIKVDTLTVLNASIENKYGKNIKYFIILFYTNK